MTINYERLGRAVEYYKNLGYTYVELPWTCSLDSSLVTTDHSKLCRLDVNGDYPHILVGSAEQAFLDIYWELEPNQRFVACTPCFRNDPEDYLHQRYFMKVELFSQSDQDHLIFMSDALGFFQQEGATPSSIETADGYDLIGHTEIELGSYGTRSVNGRTWSYGTGLAEPRFSIGL